MGFTNEKKDRTNMFNQDKYMKGYRKRNRKQLSEERKLWTKLHPEKIKNYRHKDYLKHKEHIVEKSKAWKKTHGVYLAELRHKWRVKTLETLGGKCVRCGFDDVRALQIDHIKAGGAREIGGLSSIAYFKKVIASHLRHEGKYQLLCANCNWIKRYENNEHKFLIKEVC